MISKKNSLTTFLLSLLLHLLFFTLFLMYAFRKSSFVILKTKSSTEEIPASMKPRKGSLNDVFFDFNDPSLEKISYNKTYNNQIAEPKSVEPKSVEPKSAEPKSAEPKPAESKLAEKKPTVKIPEKRFTPEELKDIAINNLLKKVMQQDPPKPKNFSDTDSSKISVPLNIGVPGIAKSMGNDLAERKGDDNKKPTFEDLKYVCYLRKVARCIEQDIQTILNTFRGGSGEVEIMFEIGKHGNLKVVETLFSNQKVLQGLISNAIKSSAPYPPVPDHFGKEYFLSKIHLRYKNKPNYTSMEGAIYGLI